MPDPSAYTTTETPYEVPVQRDTYFLALNEYVREGDAVLDVGCGLGYGLVFLAIKAGGVSGIDVDPKAVEHCLRAYGKNPKLAEVRLYDGLALPFADKSFDVVTSVDVIEHVSDYHRFVDELLRVARRTVVIGTPNRRPENTRPDGKPRNHWHLREWTHAELAEILSGHGADVDWHFLNGPADGPYRVEAEPGPDTQALVPALWPGGVRQ